MRPSSARVGFAPSFRSPMSSTAPAPLASSNTITNEPSSAELAAQAQALAKIVDSSLLPSKTTSSDNKKKRRSVDTRRLLHVTSITS
jgi:hypothetical protein